MSPKHCMIALRFLAWPYLVTNLVLAALPGLVVRRSRDPPRVTDPFLGRRRHS